MNWFQTKTKSWAVVNGIVSLGVALGIFWLVLYLPLPSEIGLAVRYGFQPAAVLLGIFGLAGILTLPDRVGRFALLGTGIALFALALNAAWSNALGEMHMLGGLVYFSDTSVYLAQVQNFLNGRIFGSIAARRPFFPGFFALLYALTGRNLQLSLGFLVCMNALGWVIAVRVFRERFGAIAAGLWGVLLFVFYRRFIGTPDSENLGFLLGCLGTALLIGWGNPRRFSCLLIGLALLTSGLLARAGAILVLPSTVLWILWLESRDGAGTRRLLYIFSASLLVVTGVFLFHFFIHHVYADPSHTISENYGQTLYGIAAGGEGWEQIYRDYPETLRMPPERAGKRIVELAVQKIRSNPALFLRGLMKGWSDYFSLKDDSAFGFIAGGELVSLDRIDSRMSPIYAAVRVILWVLSGLALFYGVWKKHPDMVLLVFAWVGVALCVPFLPPRDAGLMRIYAATIPLQCALPAAGLNAFLSLFRSGRVVKNSVDAASGVPGFGLIYGVFIFLTVVSGPSLARLISRTPELEKLQCVNGGIPLYIEVDAGAQLHIWDDRLLARTFVPDVRYSDFILSIDRFPYRDVIVSMKELKPPFTLANSVNLLDGNAVWLLSYPSLQGARSAVYGVCGRWDDSMQSWGMAFFIVQSVQKEFPY